MVKKIVTNQQIVIELLRQLGNPHPSPEHAALAEKILFSASISRQMSFHSQLTSNEACCLYWAAQGYNTRKTANIMSTKLCTIESYRKEIKRKLQCDTIAQAIFEGICFGYVPTKT